MLNFSVWLTKRTHQAWHLVFSWSTKLVTPESHRVIHPNFRQKSNSLIQPSLIKHSRILVNRCQSSIVCTGERKMLFLYVMHKIWHVMYKTSRQWWKCMFLENHRLEASGQALSGEKNLFRPRSPRSMAISASKEANHHECRCGVVLVGSSRN